MQRKILCWTFAPLLSSLLVTLSISGHVVVQNSTSTPAASNTAIQSPADASSAQGKKDVQSYKLSPEKYQKAIAYSRAQYWEYFIGTAYFLVILLLRWRTAAKLRDLATRASSRYVVRLLLFAPLFMLLLGVLDLPTSLYGQWLSLKYDQSIQGWGSWFWDWTKGEFLALVFGTLFIGILYGVIRRSPRRWWFYFWLVAVPILLFIFFIQPVVIDPLFNKFEPLETTHPELVVSIEKVVSRAGLTIPRDQIFLMKASEKTKQVNAYVTGLGTSKRVVIWDTMIAAEPGPAIMHTLGHEIGHYVLGHIWSGFAFFAALTFLVFFLAKRLFDWALTKWGSGWGIHDDWASLPLLIMIVFLLFFLCTPIGNAFSRYQEHEADRYGLEVIHGIVDNPGEVAAQAFQVEGEIDLQDPAPPAFIEFWLYDHPALNDRILFSRTYNPWARGEKPKYVR
ncbi:MAG: M48 family metallopeptidase [Candidatus Acidiferrales bacterium]